MHPNPVQIVDLLIYSSGARSFHKMLVKCGGRVLSSEGSAAPHTLSCPPAEGMLLGACPASAAACRNLAR